MDYKYKIEDGKILAVSKNGIKLPLGDYNKYEFVSNSIGLNKIRDYILVKIKDYKLWGKCFYHINKIESLINSTMLISDNEEMVIKMMSSLDIVLDFICESFKEELKSKMEKKTE